MRLLKLPPVERSQAVGEFGNITPPLSPEAEPDQRLAWCAAVVALDTGLAIRLFALPAGSFWVVEVEGERSNSMPFGVCRGYLTGLAAGGRYAAHRGAQRVLRQAASRAERSGDHGGAARLAALANDLDRGLVTTC